MRTRYKYYKHNVWGIIFRVYPGITKKFKGVFPCELYNRDTGKWESKRGTNSYINRHTQKISSKDVLSELF